MPYQGDKTITQQMNVETLDDNKLQTQSSSSITSTSLTSSNAFLLQSRPIQNQNMPFDDSDRTRSKWLRFELALNMLNHMLIGFVTIYLSWMCIKADLKKTALHAWLCTIGFNFLMAEGVMTHYNGNNFLFFYSRKTKTTVHWVLQALGGSLGIAGGIVKIVEKPVHFTTVHGKVGLAAMIICGVSMLTGLTALFSQDLKRLIQPLLNKTFHNFLGIAGFVLAMVAQYYGYETGFFKFQTEAGFRTMMEAFTIVIILVSCWGPLKALWEKCRNIKENF